MHTTAHPATTRLNYSFSAASCALARKRAINAEWDKLTPEERACRYAERERADQIRHEHSVRAREAMKRQRKPRPLLPPPERTRRFCQPVAMDVVLDPNLTPGDARCIVLIMSECGRYRQRLLTNGYLASLLHRSERQVQRYISKLERLGYIKTWPQLHPVTKCTIGRYVRPLSPCFPYWHSEGPGDIEKPLSHWNQGRDTQGPHKPSKSKKPYKEYKLSTDANPAESPFRHRAALGVGPLSFEEDEKRYGYDPNRGKGG